jgi:hypothetical protein
MGNILPRELLLLLELVAHQLLNYLHISEQHLVLEQEVPIIQSFIPTLEPLMEVVLQRLETKQLVCIRQLELLQLVEIVLQHQKKKIHYSELHQLMEMVLQLLANCTASTELVLHQDNLVPLQHLGTENLEEQLELAVQLLAIQRLVCIPHHVPQVVKELALRI